MSKQLDTPALLAEIDRWIDLEHKMMERATEAEEELESAQARVVQLERALREIAALRNGGSAEVIARSVLGRTA